MAAPSSSASPASLWRSKTAWKWTVRTIIRRLWEFTGLGTLTRLTWWLESHAATPPNSMEAKPLSISTISHSLLSTLTLERGVSWIPCLLALVGRRMMDDERYKDSSLLAGDGKHLLGSLVSREL